MAGDWLKIREDLHEDPAVLWMASQLNTRPEHVVGYCVRFWGWVSRNCHAGSVTNVTLASLESVTNLPGFCDMMRKVGWLAYDEPGGVPTITIPNFDRYLSQGAKQRALAAERQKRSREKRHDSVTDSSRSQRDKSVTREEKRRYSETVTETDTETESQPGRTKNPGTHEPPDINTLRCVPITAIPIGRVNPSAVFDVLTPEMLANPSQVISWFRRQLNASSPVLDGNYADLLLAVCASRRASGRGIKQPVGSFVSLVTKRNWRGVIRYRKEAEAAIAAVLESDLPTKPSETGCAT